MKPLFLALAAVPLLLSMVQAAQPARSAKPASPSPLVLAENGAAKAVIVVAPGASKPVKHAAQELAEFLGQVTGGDFESVSALKPGAANILVGEGAAKLAYPKFSVSDLGADGMVLRRAGNTLILAGGEPRGTLYAVYSFLEDNVGCHWWTAKASTIPKKATLAVGSLDRRYIPPFEHRDIMIAPNTNDPDWSVRNKALGELHGYGHYDIMEERGGTRKQHPPGHSYFYVMPPDKYFASHPEYYSLIEGKRQSSPSIHASLCLTNKDLRAEFAKNLLREVRDAPQLYAAGGAFYAGWIADTPRPFVFASVSPPDDSGYPDRCQCEVCRAAEKKFGGPAGLMLDFTNEMARAVKAQYPEMLITVFAYHYNQKPPTNIKADPNVVVYFCPIHASYSKPFTDVRNKRWMDDFIGWTKIASRAYLYDYPDNVSYEQVPHPNFHVLAENIRASAKIGAKGYFGDGMNGGTIGTEMYDLRAWFVARLLWDPSQDADKLIDIFTDGYYGAGGKDVAAYIGLMTKSVDEAGDWLGLSSPPTASFLSIEALTDGMNLLKSAERKVKDNPEQLARVRVAQLPVKFVFLSRWTELADLAYNRGIPWPLASTREAAYNDFKATMDANGVAPNYATRTELENLGKSISTREPAPVATN